MYTRDISDFGTPPPFRKSVSTEKIATNAPNITPSTQPISTPQVPVKTLSNTNQAQFDDNSSNAPSSKKINNLFKFLENPFKSFSFTRATNNPAVIKSLADELPKKKKDTPLLTILVEVLTKTRTKATAISEYASGPAGIVSEFIPSSDTDLPSQLASLPSAAYLLLRWAGTIQEGTKIIINSKTLTALEKALDKLESQLYRVDADKRELVKEKIVELRTIVKERKQELNHSLKILGLHFSYSIPGALGHISSAVSWFSNLSTVGPILSIANPIIGIVGAVIAPFSEALNLYQSKKALGDLKENIQDLKNKTYLKSSITEKKEAITNLLKKRREAENQKKEALRKLSNDQLLVKLAKIKNKRDEEIEKEWKSFISHFRENLNNDNIKDLKGFNASLFDSTQINIFKLLEAEYGNEIKEGSFDLAMLKGLWVNDEENKFINHLKNEFLIERIINFEELELGQVKNSLKAISVKKQKTEKKFFKFHISKNQIMLALTVVASAAAITLTVLAFVGISATPFGFAFIPGIALFAASATLLVIGTYFLYKNKPNLFSTLTKATSLRLLLSKIPYYIAKRRLEDQRGSLRKKIEEAGQISVFLNTFGEKQSIRNEDLDNLPKSLKAKILKIREEDKDKILAMVIAENNKAKKSQDDAYTSFLKREKTYTSWKQKLERLQQNLDKAGADDFAISARLIEMDQKIKPFIDYLNKNEFLTEGYFTDSFDLSEEVKLELLDIADSTPFFDHDLEKPKKPSPELLSSLPDRLLEKYNEFANIENIQIRNAKLIEIEKEWKIYLQKEVLYKQMAISAEEAAKQSKPMDTARIMAESIFNGQQAVLNGAPLDNDTTQILLDFWGIDIEEIMMKLKEESNLSKDALINELEKFLRAYLGSSDLESLNKERKKRIFDRKVEELRGALSTQE